MGKFIIEAVADFRDKQHAVSTQNRIDQYATNLDGSMIDTILDAAEKNSELINSCIELARQGKKTAMLVKLGQALISGKLKL